MSISRENFSPALESESKKNKLLDQAMEPEQFGDSLLVDIVPEQQKTEVPVFLAPGWASGVETFREVAVSIAEQNRRVLTVTYGRKAPDKRLFDPELEQKYQSDELRKSLVLLDVLNDKQIPQVDVIAHSEAAIHSLITAALAPEKIKSLTLVNPAGLVERSSVIGITARFLKQCHKSLTEMHGSRPDMKPVIRRYEKEAAQYFLANPVRSIKEAAAIAKTQTFDLLEELHRLGVKIAVVAGVEDPIFQMENIQKMAQKSLPDQGFYRQGKLVIDGFYSVSGDHIELLTSPGKYGRALEKIVGRLTAKREKENNANT